MCRRLGLGVVVAGVLSTGLEEEVLLDPVAEGVRFCDHVGEGELS